MESGMKRNVPAEYLVYGEWCFHDDRKEGYKLR
jgi:hypothetical protein